MPAGGRGNTGGECGENVGGGVHLHLLLLKFEVPDAVKGATDNAELLRSWQQICGVGLGPFIFLCGRRTTNEDGGFHVVVRRPIDMQLPLLVERCLRHADLRRRDRRTPRLRFVQFTPLRGPQLQLLGDVVEGLTLFVTEEKLVTVSSATGQTVTDDSEEANGETDEVEKLSAAEETFLSSLLQQTSAWSVELLNRCGVLTGGGVSLSKELRGRGDVEMAVRALRYLQQATCARPRQKTTMDIVGIVVEWAALMYSALAAYPPPQEHVKHAGEAEGATSTWAPPAMPPAQEFLAGRGESMFSQEEQLGSPQRLTPPHPLHPSHLSSPLGPDDLTMDRRDGRGSGASEEAGWDAIPPQTQGNIPIPRQMPSCAVTAAKAHNLPFMSVCSEVLEAAFHLQQNGTQCKPSHVNHSVGGGGEQVGGEDGGLAVVGAAPATQLSCREGSIQSTSGSCGGEDDFLPSLIHRLVSVCHAPSNSRLAGRLSRIAAGDFFPSHKMLEKADLLRQRLGRTLVVRFYDLDPQKPPLHRHQSCLHDGPTAQSSSFAASVAAAGFLNSTEHPCYMFLTHTDIILVSAFDANYPPSSLWVTSNKNSTAFDLAHNEKSSSSSSSGSCRDDNNAAVSDHGSRRRDDAPICMQHVFVIPRVSLMGIRRLHNTADAGMATLLRLQTRSCRRIWLAFQEASELQHVYLELNSGLQTSSGNRFLASAQRNWRMTALTLVAGDVLPIPHTPFYQQVLQNLLAAFADVESRREHTPTASAEPLVASDSAGGAPLAVAKEEEDLDVGQGGLKTLSYSWWLYSPMREYVRQGIPSRQWRLSSVNSRYQHFPSYPAKFVVPGCLNDDALIESASLRTRMRVEALSYYCSSTGAGIVRAAQPAAANICASASKVDAVKLYRRACGMQVCTFDLRSRITAYANTVLGGGFSMETGRYCHLSNIHVVREAYETLIAAVLDSNPSFLAVMLAAGKMSTSRNDTSASATPFGSSATVESPVKAADVWNEHIHGLLRTATDAARLITGVSEGDALAPAIPGTAADTLLSGRNVMGGGVSPRKLMSGNSGNVGGISDRLIPRSSTVYVWKRAFSAIPFRNSRWRNSGDDGDGTFWRLAQKQMSAQPPPSYTQLDNRKHAQLVIVNCSDGWDRTSQVCALTQLLVDPYFRTMEGFITLLEKEFVSFGHPCLLRSSTLQSHSEAGVGAAVMDGSYVGVHDSHRGPAFENCQSSPILLQFLNAVQQLLRLYPHCFEFTETFLLLIVDLMHAGILGTFAVNCEGDVLRWGVEQQTLSLSQFCAVLFATTIRTGSNPLVETTENGEGSSEVEEHTGCGSPASPAVPLRCFYRSCGGGATLPGVGCGSADSAPRRIPVSYDAMCHSGLLNPHFSLADNKLLFGPLVDVVRPLQLQLWEGFFLRHSFWCERPAKLRQFSEQSSSTVHATLVAATGTTMAAPSLAFASATALKLLPVGGERRPHTTPTAVFRPTDLGDVPSLRMHSAVAASPQLNMTRRTSTSGISTSSPQGTQINPILIGGRADVARGGNPFVPCTLHCDASCGSLATFSSSPSAGVQSLEHLQKLPSTSLYQRGSIGVVSTVGSAMSDHCNPLADGAVLKRQSLATLPSGVESLGSPPYVGLNEGRYAQQKTALTEPAGAQAHSYNALLDVLDHAFN
ncbi:4-nitrophenylphosphatase/protein-tyrosine phosphatase [Trypanosoma rangeli]|uniref:4-nitrophenylphosphatase/protein-tyrosine phosphatase n=1 Tax=Trypanosoma rangeli TaxID=5698 RepID=A0A3R7M009_TRYRA|nr:4-nitrophenylphosphatase/protein-tyrosine phosphatase [Trypanosoma rangeli]RNE96860.1 4-nitrophenylphosphatase/protein-tyrosine phosphatase [Trypanosoma rangeli]|eukprot:RNE96860.1 4-nitrophenylphosphatase/protein-tyrosine phosphatase [Trypanosoma rangeli]